MCLAQWKELGLERKKKSKEILALSLSGCETAGKVFEQLLC
jgi:hypothetical protein